VDAARDYDTELHEWCADCYDDPLAFVLGAYDWPINGEPGPDAWQRGVLDELGRAVAERGFDGGASVVPIRKAISSGHGIGKTALFAWIVDWLMSTRRNCRGTVTANTNDQLEIKTWAGIREWTQRCITAHWFEINSAIMFRKGYRSTWNTVPQTCAEENSEAFQGQHAKGSTSFYIFDEASAVPDSIWKAAEGGLTDEPIILVGGNPTRNTGTFYECVFGKQRDRWGAHIIDSRSCKLAPHALIQQWLEDYGEDSDFFRVRVRGLAPLASELQYIDGQRIIAAQKRRVVALEDEPLVAGVDVSGGGAAWTVCRFRRGLDARSIAPIRLTGEQTRDRGVVVAILQEQFRVHPDLVSMFIDSAFGGPIIQRLIDTGYDKEVIEVNFGGPSPDKHFARMRPFMWGRMKDWLERGGIDATDTRLETDLGGPGYHLNRNNQVELESKESMVKRGVASPDDGDALALTFAQVVRIPSGRRKRQWQPVPATWQA